MGDMRDSHNTVPNWGHSVDAHEAIINQQTLQEWKKSASISFENQIKLVKLSHMRYQHKDMDTITTFLKGMYANKSLES